MFDRIKNTAQATAKRAALGLAGAAVMSIGIGFLTVAAWIALSVAADHMTAAIVLGATYFGAGLITVVIAQRPKSNKRHFVTEQSHTSKTGGDQYAKLAAVFLQGLSAGVAARQERPAGHPQ